MIKAVYKIPSIKHTFLIVEPLDVPSWKYSISKKIEVSRELIEHILRSKDHIDPKEVQRWTHIRVSSEDFLAVLEKCTPRGQVSSIQSSHNPEDLELLAINLLKTPVALSDSHETSKVLGFISEEDVIEVFI